MNSDEEPETSEYQDGSGSTTGSGAMILLAVIGVLVIVGFLYSTMTR